ncbi:hypothetical protein B0H15DRAFT_955595 [Mycena belliarum]|uniref:Uncharacterized protein n=1 Tax=Mycena belliarum TaxID=1033014 RepID=A0AAD6TWA0_9AGAR|nr:hypothetical protein B0H15DRAFT_955595 [Mycena belliae]
MSPVIEPEPHQPGAPSIAFENATTFAAADDIVEHDDDATLVETETRAVGVGLEGNNRAFFDDVFRDTRAFIDEYNDISTAHPYAFDVPGGDRMYAGELGVYPAWNQSDGRAGSTYNSTFRPVAGSTSARPANFERVKHALRNFAKRLRRFFK